MKTSTELLRLAGSDPLVLSVSALTDFLWPDFVRETKPQVKYFTDRFDNFQTMFNTSLVVVGHVKYEQIIKITFIFHSDPSIWLLLYLFFIKKLWNV